MRRRARPPHRSPRSSARATNALDGTVPRRAAGDEIPIGARIVAVCDAYDAMIANRPYSPPKRTDDALTELRRCAGTQFDAQVVDTFAAVLADRTAAKLAA